MKLVYRTGPGHCNPLKFFLFTANTRKNSRIMHIPKIIKNSTNSVRNDNTTCFAGYRGHMQANKKAAYTRIMYHFVPDEACSVINKGERKTFLKLARKNKFIPGYINIEEMERRKRFVLDITCHSPNLLYIYLSTVRLMETDPHIIKNTLIMVNEGIPFTLALVAGAMIGMHNMNHMFLPDDRSFPYGVKATNLKSLSVRLEYVAGLYALVNDLGCSAKVKASNHGFNCNETIRQTFCSNPKRPQGMLYKDYDDGSLVIKPEDFKSQLLLNAIMAESKETFIKAKERFVKECIVRETK